MVCKHLASQLKILRSQNLNMTSSLMQLQEEIKEKNKSLKMAETKDKEEKAQQAANEAMFQRRMDDEILKERQRTEDAIKQIKNDEMNKEHELRNEIQRLKNQNATLDYE